MSTRTPYSASELQQKAGDHLWLHFSRLSELRAGEIPIITSGDGCYLTDINGNRYLDALAGLFSVNIGYGYGEEMGQAAAEQLQELPFYTNWSYAHPRAIELATELSELLPGDLNRVFFTSGGSESIEAAWKLARQWHLMNGDQRRWKAISRNVAYHGTTMGALSITGVSSLRTPFEPLVPSVARISNTIRYHRPPEETEAEFTQFLLDELVETIEAEGPETVAMLVAEPVQNAGGAITPPAGYWQGLRRICDEYGILLCADEVICGFGRLGTWFGADKYDIRPDLMTLAKGLTSSYGSMGALAASDKVAAPFLEGPASYLHGITFGGHPLQAALALKNIEIMKRDRIVENVADNQQAFRDTLDPLLDLEIVGEIRGTGYFWAIELVKDKETRETFSDEECEWLLRKFLSHRLWDEGLICRADDRGDPVIQLSPPLVATQQQFDEITDTLGRLLTEAQERLHRSSLTAV